jgi:hypothetical protein
MTIPVIVLCWVFFGSLCSWPFTGIVGYGGISTLMNGGFMIKQKYIDYAFNVADIVWDRYDETRKKGFEQACELLRGKGAFMNPLRFAGTVAPGEAMRYKQTGDKQYLERARTYLLDVYEINSELTAYQQRENITIRNNDFPMLDWMFEPEPYINAYNMIKEEACFTEDEVKKIEKVVELSLAPILKMPEYGPMNRSMLRALNLASAGVSFPDHKDSARWLKMGKHIFADSLDKWSMEDSPSYQSIWVYSFIVYNDYVPTVDINENPMVKYHADMWARLVSPLGYIPPYGDSHIGHDWTHLAAVIERCATVYQSGTLKYAVSRYVSAHLEKDMGLAGGLVRFIQQLISAYNWADDELEEQVPLTLTQEVSDDTLGKKCVFRSGWEKDDTYLMLNYRDELPVNEIYKKSLTMTIPVKAEKTHHGHNDENSLSMLISKGRYFLTESGYRRDGRDCAYRSDYFHNKLIVRRGVNRAHSFYDYIMDYGEYNPVKTERVFLYNFEEYDSSRTRLHDSQNGAVALRAQGRG